MYKWIVVSDYDWITKTTSLTHHDFKYCEPNSSHAAGSSWSTSTAHAATVTGGLSIPGTGIGANVQRGFGDGVDMRFNFKQVSTLCFTNVNGPLSSGQISAKQAS
jgi:hypothetical protein